jgi:hypothetical protein
MILKGHTKKKNLLNIINTSGNVEGYMINIQNPVVFLHINNNQAKVEIRKTIPFTIASKISRNKLN